jgi:cell wall assembly regulator SMI1
MRNLWAKYVAWLQSNYPVGLTALNPGATDAEIAHLESEIGVKLPDDYITLLKIHNGQSDLAAGLLWSNEFLSTTRILGEWKAMKELLDGGDFMHPTFSDPPNAIKPDWWNIMWVPITSDGNGNLECIDLRPGKSGKRGQIIDFDHEAADRCVLANNFRVWLEEYIQAVIKDEYLYSDDYGRLMPQDEL